MKPSWNDPSCPEWANYLARDEDGVWIWFEEKPTQKNDCYWLSSGKAERVVEETYWCESLEERPKQ